MYDVVIVGGGPAGLSAALYCARRSLSTVIISKDVGGQAASTSVIENYPGVGAVDGAELMQRFKQQAVDQGAEFVLGEVKGITKLSDGNFETTYNNETMVSRSIVLAFGLTPRNLNVPGEEQLSGKGVYHSTAGVRDLMKNKNVAVVGGGNSALETSIELGSVAKKVFLIHRRDTFRAEEVLVKSMQESSNVEQVLNAQVAEIIGSDKVQKITITQKGESDVTRELEVDAVFINAGFMSAVKFVSNIVELNKKNEIIVDETCHTSSVGVFAAGDVTTSKYKQVIVSAGEGCKAALECYTYLMELDGKEVKIDQDWKVSNDNHFIRT
ncbi:MAG: FAD-dependent oxidoreductase [bacterium]|nr:FAD-dependent oxidoreductase [bacterium]